MHLDGEVIEQTAGVFARGLEDQVAPWARLKAQAVIGAEEFRFERRACGACRDVEHGRGLPFPIALFAGAASHRAEEPQYATTMFGDQVFNSETPWNGMISSISLQSRDRAA